MLKIYRKNDEINKTFLYATLINFLIILCWIVIFKVNRSWVPEMVDYFHRHTFSERIGKNIIPGYSIISSIKNNGFSFSSDHFLNVLVFLPYGILLPFFFKKKNYFYTVLTVIASTLFFELFQLFTLIGYFDTSDFITNILGGCLGLLLYKYVFSKTKGGIINIISSTITVIASPVSVYAIVNTIIHIDYYI